MPPGARGAARLVVDVMNPRAIGLDVRARVGSVPDLEHRGGTENELGGDRDDCGKRFESRAGQAFHDSIHTLRK